MYTPVSQLQGTVAKPDDRKFVQSDIMGKDAFLNLLVTQLQNQNPLEPMKDQEFVAQLAQFSSLEELKNLGSSIGLLLALQESSINAQSVSLIGKQVRVQADKVDSSKITEPVQFEIKVDEETNVLFKVYDASNQVVHTEIRTNASGKQIFQWDGTSDNGETLPEGIYRVEATSTIKTDGTYSTFPPFVVGPVLGVDFSSGTTLVTLPGGIEVDLSHILEVRPITQSQTASSRSNQTSSRLW